MRGGWPRKPKPQRRVLSEHFLHTGKPKRSFPTRGAAERFASETKQNAGAYCCSFCGRWHNASRR